MLMMAFVFSALLFTTTTIWMAILVLKQQVKKLSYTVNKNDPSITIQLNQKLRQEFGFDFVYIAMIFFAFLAWQNSVMIPTLTAFVVPTSLTVKCSLLTIVNLASTLINYLFLKQTRTKNEFIQNFYKEYNN
ncbi:hypothetical protein [Companilactobacillus kimchiensis]|uniref:Uncharacterized protein n=1 Tax=Companilactobacillus kimchiensis TaxID=993692 RepID=A0A0R2LKS4_9LACO|nr:hypothetical protein [Companilactobacillus kimchiensis]KRO00796.1 hypothetical protein IV57_GL000116 [Companilactobacillus kimchiensis]